MVVVVAPPIVVVVVALAVVVVVGAGGTEPVTGVWLFFDFEQPVSSAPEMASTANVTFKVREVMDERVATGDGPSRRPRRGTIGAC